MSREDEIRNLFEIYQRRLQKLKEQKAYLGVSTPPHVSMDIEDTEAELEALQAALEAERNALQPPPSFSRGGRDRYDPPAPHHRYKKRWQTTIPHPPKCFLATPDHLCAATETALHFLSAKDGSPLFPPLTTVGGVSLADYTVIGGAACPPDIFLLTLLSSQSFDKGRLVALKLTRKDFESSKGPAVQWVYEGPGMQLSTPYIDNRAVYLIQSGPEFVELDLEQGQAQRAIPLPQFDNLYRDCVSFVFGASRLCMALCRGEIVTLDRQTGKVLASLHRDPNGRDLSILATDGISLFFGTSADRKTASPSRICALNIDSGEKIWDFETPPAPSGRRRPVKGRPLVVHNTLYAGSRNHYLHALDLDTGQEQWSYEMSDQIELGPVWTGTAVAVADRQGNIHALQVDTPAFIVTCHYDLDTPPILNEWNSLVFTVINTGYGLARNTTLRLSGDFEGVSEHHTQKLQTISPGDIKSFLIPLKPTAAGAMALLAVTVGYRDDEDFHHTRRLNLFVPVRRSRSERVVWEADGRRRYNYTALHALVMACLTKRELSRLCIKHFAPIYDKLVGRINRWGRIAELVEYVDQTQQVDRLLSLLQQHCPARYAAYEEAIILPVSSPPATGAVSPTANFDVFLAHNSQDKPQVEAIADKLKQWGLRPWLDKEQIPPGRWFQDVIQEAITKVKSVAVFIGPGDLGKWQRVEVRSFLSRCVDSDLPVIPILLPGVNDIPADLLFLKELHWVRFPDIDDLEALNNLVWGITGVNPHAYQAKR